MKYGSGLGLTRLALGPQIGLFMRSLVPLTWVRYLCLKFKPCFSMKKSSGTHHCRTRQTSREIVFRISYICAGDCSQRKVSQLLKCFLWFGMVFYEFFSLINQWYSSVGNDKLLCGLRAGGCVSGVWLTGLLQWLPDCVHAVLRRLQNTSSGSWPGVCKQAARDASEMQDLPPKQPS